MISSDSAEQRNVFRNILRVRESQNLPTRRTFLMNRLNWITYLKILYDQLEKIKKPVEVQKKKSFLGSAYSHTTHFVEAVSRE
jgi:hypothetical protein